MDDDLLGGLVPTVADELNAQAIPDHAHEQIRRAFVAWLETWTGMNAPVEDMIDAVKKGR